MTAYVPFVDVINTMLDASLPLTTQEYIEWGNQEKDAYLYMKSYDPYGNVQKKAYPAMLVRTSLNDSQVGYWEGAKWVARLRANKTDDNRHSCCASTWEPATAAPPDATTNCAKTHDYAWLIGQWG